MAAATTDWKIPKQAGLWILGATVLAASVGAVIGLALQPEASDDRWPLGGADEGASDCALPASVSGSQLDSVVSITQFPETVTIDVGDGRGRRVVANDQVAVTPTSVPGVVEDGAPVAADGLPAAIPLEVLPLRAAKGRQIDSVSSYLDRIGDTQSYQLVVCVDAGAAEPGSYTAAIAVPEANASAEYTPALTVNVQHQWVMPLLWIGVPWLLMLGLGYTSVLLLRRSDPAFNPFNPAHHKYVYGAFFSANGVLAVVGATIAAWSVWRVTVYDKISWGADPIEIVVSIGAMAGAISGAAAVPFGLSSAKVDIAGDVAAAGAAAEPSLPPGGAQPPAPLPPAAEAAEEE